MQKIDGLVRILHKEAWLNNGVGLMIKHGNRILQIRTRAVMVLNRPALVAASDFTVVVKPDTLRAPKALSRPGAMMTGKAEKINQ